RVMVAQAIPSVAPSRAAAYFHNTECFCFTQQVLQPGESVEMAVRFIVDPALPKDVRRLTLAYTLFDVTERMAPSLGLHAMHSNKSRLAIRRRRECECWEARILLCDGTEQVGHRRRHCPAGIGVRRLPPDGWPEQRLGRGARPVHPFRRPAATVADVLR